MKKLMLVAGVVLFGVSCGYEPPTEHSQQESRVLTRAEAIQACKEDVNYKCTNPVVLNRYGMNEKSHPALYGPLSSSSSSSLASKRVDRLERARAYKRCVRSFSINGKVPPHVTNKCFEIYFD